MKKNAFVVVKKIRSAEEFDDKSLHHCVFWALKQRGEKGKKGECPFDSITDIKALKTALSEKLEVFAIAETPLEVPVVVENVVSYESQRKYNVYMRFSVKINITKEFYDWLIGTALPERQRDFLFNTELSKECYDRLVGGVKSLMNGEKENVGLIVRFHREAVGKIGEDKFAKYLPGWAELAGDKISICDAEPVGENSAQFIEIRRAVTDIDIPPAPPPPPPPLWKKVLKFFFWLAMFGCLTGGVAYWLQPKGVEQPALGSVSVSTASAGDAKVAADLRTKGEAFVRELIARKSNEAVAWGNGKQLTFRIKDWAQIAIELQRFAEKSGGEFTCDVINNDITLIPHPERIKSVVYDVAALAGHAELVKAVEDAYQVRFYGRSEIGPVPLRAAAARDALEKIEKTVIRVKLQDEGARLVFFVDPSLIKKADDFWANVAPERLSALSHASDGLKAALSECAAKMEAGMEVPSSTLAAFGAEIAELSKSVESFIADCRRDWLKYATTLLQDKEARLSALKADVTKLSSLHAATSAAHHRLLVKRDVAAFNDAKTEFLAAGAELMSCYDAQQARIAKLQQLLQQIGNAKSMRRYGWVSHFKQKIADATAEMEEHAVKERADASRIGALCTMSYYNSTFGDEWVSLVVGKYGKSNDIRQIVQEAAQNAAVEICRVFGATPVEKALEKGRQIAVRVENNFKSTGMLDTDTEASLLDQVNKLYTDFCNDWQASRGFSNVLSAPSEPPSSPDGTGILQCGAGALCKVYYIPLKSRYATQSMHDELLEKLNSAVAVDVDYDVAAVKFDAKSVARHQCNVAVWQGELPVEKSGKYVFTVNSGFDYIVRVADMECVGGGRQHTFSVDLREGLNKIQIIRLIATDVDFHGPKPMGYEAKKNFALEYRRADAVGPAIQITPRMLKHIV